MCTFNFVHFSDLQTISLEKNKSVYAPMAISARLHNDNTLSGTMNIRQYVQKLLILLVILIILIYSLLETCPQCFATRGRRGCLIMSKIMIMSKKIKRLYTSLSGTLYPLGYLICIQSIHLFRAERNKLMHPHVQ